MFNYKRVGVRFVNGTLQTYYYLTDDFTIEVGDYLVVISGTGVPALVIVNDANAVDINKKATKVVVQKVALTEYKEKMKQATEHRQKLERLEELEAQFSKIDKYKMLAATNEEVAKLLIELGYVTKEEIKS